MNEISFTLFQWSSYDRAQTPSRVQGRRFYNLSVLCSLYVFFIDIMNRMSLNVNDYISDRILMCDAILVKDDFGINASDVIIRQPQVFSTLK